MFQIKLGIDACFLCKYVSLELEKHAVSGSLLNVLRENPVKIVSVQYMEA